VVEQLKKHTQIGGMDKDKSRHFETYKLLGENIRARRQNMKISQEELAFRVSSARNYIGCIERAEKFQVLLLS
jgi:hypothetical protein